LLIARLASYCRILMSESTNRKPLILALDTSSEVVSIAIVRGDEMMSALSRKAERRESERLWSDIDKILGNVGMKIQDINLYGVSIGPGSFTGLRIGLAAVKGFALATKAPVIGVTSLEASAMGVPSGSSVCALVNAHADDVYSQLFTIDPDGVPIHQNEPAVSRAPEAVKRVEQIDNLVFAGSAIERCLDAIRDGGGARFAGLLDDAATSGWSVHRGDAGLATRIAMLAFLKLSRGEKGTAETLSACYVRQAEAEIKLKQGLLGSKIKRSRTRMK
jgi:tRNA threonylcarbamoyladenosine biosynthesis protein TsaB